MGEQLPEELNVQRLTAEEYQQFITNIRRALGVRDVFGRPLLPPQEDQNPTHFNIVFRTNTRSITVAFRHGNLYLDGYRMGNAAQWQEFGEEPAPNNRRRVPPPPHLLRGSRFLGFGGGYDALRGASHRRIQEFRLGHQTLITAVNELAITTDGEARARYLTILIIMISEAVRLPRVSDHIVETFYEGALAPDWLDDYVHGWQDASAAVLRQEAHPDQPFPLPQPNRLGIQTLQQAIAALGVILQYKHIVRRLRRAISEFLAQALPQGRQLLEIFSVRITRNNCANSVVSLYGSIKMTDGLWCQLLYDRKERNPEKIAVGDTILLSGPARSVSAFGSFTMDVGLMNKEGVREVSRGLFSWNYYDVTNVYDKPLVYEIDGKYGTVGISYAVFSDAVEAAIEVTLVRESGSSTSPAHLNGIITARSAKFENESMLFWGTTEDTVSVRPGRVIPLLRSIAVVPVSSSLIIQANLHDFNEDSGRNSEIAYGNFRFPVKLFGSSEGSIRGRRGEIRVKVRWVN